MDGVTIFNSYFNEYDQWFDDNEQIFQAEVNALKKLVPQKGLGIEVGVGTGRFSIPFGIYMGIDPSRNMGRMAKTRNISVCQAVGEYLPFCDDEFDFVLIVTVICFMNSVRHVVDEVRRILKIGGQITIGFIDRETPLGQMYESRKNVDKFYKAAHFSPL